MDGLKLTLDEHTPFVEKFDAGSNMLKIGKFLSQMKKAGIPCILSGPSINQMEFGDEKPFSISTDACFHEKGSATYEGICVTGKNTFETLHNFAEVLHKKYLEENFICNYSKKETLYSFFDKKTLDFSLKQHTEVPA